MKNYIKVVLILVVITLTGCDLLSDNTIPEIKVIQGFETQYEVNSDEPNWVDAVNIIDDKDGTITVSEDDIDTSQVDMETVGSFDVIYEVTDSSGNNAQITLTITIIDSTHPVISGLNDITLEVGSPLPDLLNGVSATDLYDGDITLTNDNVDATNVDTDTVGTYDVVYTVQDANGNIATETITVTIEDTTVPELTLIGDSEITIILGEEYSDLGATALDNYDGDITSQVVVNNPVDVNVPGDYTITYDVTDSSGNNAVQVTRVVHVISDISLLIVDPNLEQVIRDELDKPTGEITLQDCESITELYAWSMNITDLSGIEYLKNLTDLWLEDNNISDITPIMSLFNLQIISLGNNNISNINVLKDMYDNDQLPFMTVIGLSLNPIDETIGSEAYEVIKYLTLHNILIDIAEDLIEDDHGNELDLATEIPLDSVTVIETTYEEDYEYFQFTLDNETDVTVYTSGNMYTYIRLFDENEQFITYQFLGGIDLNARLNITLPQGTYYIELRVFENVITGEHLGVSEITLETTIRDTNSPEVQFADATLKQLIKEQLNLQEEDIITEADCLTIGSFVLMDDYVFTNLSGIEYLENLTTLDLSSSQISDISALGNLINLKLLFLGDNQIIDLSPLTDLTKLEVLGLYSNNISDITPLSNLTNLIELDLDENQISDITPLSSLIKLNYLDISENQISDITPLSSLIKLNYLDISENQISDITPLSSLIKLNYLDISENQISNISVLDTLVSNGAFSSLIYDEGFNITLQDNPIDYSEGSDAYNTIFSLYDNGVITDVYDIITDDHGDTYEEATQITIGDTINGELYSYDDIDMFEFTIDHETTIDVSLLYVYTHAIVYDQYYNPINYIGVNNNRYIYSVSSGTYYVKVLGSLGVYQLSIVESDI